MRKLGRDLMIVTVGHLLAYTVIIVTNPFVAHLTA